MMDRMVSSITGAVLQHSGCFQTHLVFQTPCLQPWTAIPAADVPRVTQAPITHTLVCCTCRVERSSHFVQRRVRLPDSADFQKIQAKMDNGILKLDIPKAVSLAFQYTLLHCLHACNACPAQQPAVLLCMRTCACTAVHLQSTRHHPPGLIGKGSLLCLFDALQENRVRQHTINVE